MTFHQAYDGLSSDDIDYRAECAGFLIQNYWFAMSEDEKNIVRQIYMDATEWQAQGVAA